MSTDSWRFKRNGVEEGPVSESQLQQMLSDGMLPHDTPVYADYLGMWTPALQVATFAMCMSGGTGADSGDAAAAAEITPTTSFAPVPAPVVEPAAQPATWQSMSRAGENPAPASAAPAAAASAPAAPAPTPSMLRTPIAQESSSIPARQAAAAAAALQAGAPPPLPPDLHAINLQRTYAENPALRPHPWHRFFARNIDNIYALMLAVGIGIVILIAAGAIGSKVGGGDSETVTGVIGLIGLLFCFFLYIFLEPIMLSVSGTTLGKFLFNIRLRNAEGRKLGFGQALLRTFVVWLIAGGLANLLPIPILCTALVFGLWIYHYIQLQKIGVTKWDRDGKFTYEHFPIGIGRWFAIWILGLLPYVAMTALLVVAAIYGGKSGATSSD
jgi:uncharacterized RDD family membrane protein YckC